MKDLNMTIPEILRALADGKAVELKIGTSGVWYQPSVQAALMHLSGNFDPSRWRLKPVPVPPGDLTQEEAEALRLAGVPIQFYSGEHWVDRTPNYGRCTFSDAYRRTPTPNIVPVAPAPKMVPLEAKDVKPGDAIRQITSFKQNTWWLVLCVTSASVWARSTEISFEDLHHSLWEISHDGGATWQRAEKPEVV